MECEVRKQRNPHLKLKFVGCQSRSKMSTAAHHIRISNTHIESN